MYIVTGLDYRNIPAEILKHEGDFVKINRFKLDSTGNTKIHIKCCKFTKMHRFNKLMAKYKWPSFVQVRNYVGDTLGFFTTFTKINIKASKSCGSVRANYHNENGPAIVMTHISEGTYFLDGKKLHKDKWKQQVKKIRIKQLRTI